MILPDHTAGTWLNGFKPGISPFQVNSAHSRMPHNGLIRSIIPFHR